MPHVIRPGSPPSSNAGERQVGTGVDSGGDGKGAAPGGAGAAGWVGAAGSGSSAGEGGVGSSGVCVPSPELRRLRTVTSPGVCVPSPVGSRAQGTGASILAHGLHISRRANSELRPAGDIGMARLTTRRSRAGLWHGGRTACVMLAACCGALLCRGIRTHTASTRAAGGRSLREGYLRHVHSPWKPTIEGACVYTTPNPNRKTLSVERCGR